VDARSRGTYSRNGKASLNCLDLLQDPNTPFFSDDYQLLDARTTEYVAALVLRNQNTGAAATEFDVYYEITAFQQVAGRQISRTKHKPPRFEHETITILL
jgi:hypothetical protein